MALLHTACDQWCTLLPRLQAGINNLPLHRAWATQSQETTCSAYDFFPKVELTAIYTLAATVFLQKQITSMG